MSVYCTIPNSVTTIGSGAFWSCISLSSVTIGNNVATIGSSAFFGCHSLTAITTHAIHPPVLSGYAFLNVPDNIPVYVPCGSISTYQNSVGWKDFKNYIGMGFTDTTFIFDTVCSGEVYNSNGFNMPAVAGVYHRTIPSIYQCDSVICLNLFVHASTVTTYYSATICEGEVYNDSNFTNLTQAGMYYDTLRNINGCDSIIELTLTVTVGIMEIAGQARNDVQSYEIYDVMGKLILSLWVGDE